jgi:hypothetical protein
MSQRVETIARALILTWSSQPENGHLRKNSYSSTIFNINYIFQTTGIDINIFDYFKH